MKRRLITEDYLNEFINKFSRRAKRYIGAKKVWFGRHRGKYMIDSHMYPELVMAFVTAPKWISSIDFSINI